MQGQSIIDTDKILRGIFDNMSLGMCIGLALGVSAGSIIDAVNRKKGAQNEQEKY